MTEILLATTLLSLLVLLLTGAVIAARAILLPALPVTITVNERTTISATTGEKLLSILARAGIPIPSACGGLGTCGQCRVEIAAGRSAPLPTEVASLGPGQVARGLRLACQVVVRGRLSVKLPEEILAAEHWRAKVVSNRMLAPLIKELVLEVPPERDFAFRAGAFVQVTSPPYVLDFAEVEVDEAYQPQWQEVGWHRLQVDSPTSVSRAYSIANTPADKKQVVLNVRLAVPPPAAPEGTPPGIVSSFLFSLAPGAVVDMAGPFGGFQARETGREMIFIGGGVGMAPLRAIIFDQLERVGTRRKLSYWYGARSPVDVFYKEEFDRLAEKHENFSWTVALSDPAPGDEWQGATGLIHEVLLQRYLRDHPAPEDCEYYLCGPPLMVQAVTAMLEGIGVGDDAIFFDDFGS
jgi:Na+-transporting NADH:ubiquinone oxidoreductase subunit F